MASSDAEERVAPQIFTPDEGFEDVTHLVPAEYLPPNQTTGLLFKRVLRPAADPAGPLPTKGSKVRIQFEGRFDPSGFLYETTCPTYRSWKLLTGGSIPTMTHGIEPALLTMRAGELSEFRFKGHLHGGLHGVQAQEQKEVRRTMRKQWLIESKQASTDEEAIALDKQLFRQLDPEDSVRRRLTTDDFLRYVIELQELETSKLVENGAAGPSSLPSAPASSAPTAELLDQMDEVQKEAKKQLQAKDLKKATSSYNRVVSTLAKYLKDFDSLELESALKIKLKNLITNAYANVAQCYLTSAQNEDTKIAELEKEEKNWKRDQKQRENEKEKMEKEKQSGASSSSAEEAFVDEDGLIGGRDKVDFPALIRGRREARGKNLESVTFNAEKAVSVDEYHYKAYFRLGIAYKMLNKLHEAQDAFKASLRIAQEIQAAQGANSSAVPPEAQPSSSAVSILTLCTIGTVPVTDESIIIPVQRELRLIGEKLKKETKNSSFVFKKGIEKSVGSLYTEKGPENGVVVTYDENAAFEARYAGKQVCFSSDGDIWEGDF